MTGVQELLEALRSARQCTVEAASQATPQRVAAQAQAVDRLEACLKGGLPPLGPGDAEAVAAELKQLLKDNRFLLRWSQIRSQWARIGLPAPVRSAAPGPRLDLVS
jgi:TctA family transporter